MECLHQDLSLFVCLFVFLMQLVYCLSRLNGGPLSLSLFVILMPLVYYLSRGNSCRLCFGVNK
jgi:hypothetical protein